MADQSSAQASPAPASDQHILNSATNLLGLTGSGKSALLATLMEWLWENYRAVTFYYLFDGGGFPTQVQALINRGICRLWRVRTRAGEGLAPETIQRAAMGWWPTTIDPRTGVTAPTVKLVAPITTIYTMSCPQGHVVKSSAAQAALLPGPCPTCKVMVDRTNMKVATQVRRTTGFPEKRAVMYDGITAACSWLLDDLSHRTLGGEQSRLGGTVQSGDLVFGENNRAQVGFTQNSSERWVLASSAIPDLVIPPVWTALTKEGSDEASLTVVGPDLAGQAKIAVAGQWFGNTVEALVVERGGKKYRQLRTSQWVDEKMRRHLCRVGSYPGAIPAIFEEEEHENGEGAFAQFNLGLFHQRLADARKTTEASYDARYQDAPGLPTAGESTYGDAGGAQSSAPVPAAQGARPANAPPAVATVATVAAVAPSASGRPATPVRLPTTLPPASPSPQRAGAVVSGADVGAVTPADRQAAKPVGVKPAVGAGLATAAAAAAAVGPPSPAAVKTAVGGAPLPPATIGPPKGPVAGPAIPHGGGAPPPGRKPTT